MEVPCAAFHVSVAMVTGEVPARAAEAEGGVGEGAAGGGGGGEEVPRGGGWMSAVLLLRAHTLEIAISDHVDAERIVRLQLTLIPHQNASTHCLLQNGCGKCQLWVSCPF